MGASCPGRFCCWTTSVDPRLGAARGRGPQGRGGSSSPGPVPWAHIKAGLRGRGTVALLQRVAPAPTVTLTEEGSEGLCPGPQETGGCAQVCRAGGRWPVPKALPHRGGGLLGGRQVPRGEWAAPSRVGMPSPGPGSDCPWPCGAAASGGPLHLTGTWWGLGLLGWLLAWPWQPQGWSQCEACSVRERSPERGSLAGQGMGAAPHRPWLVWSRPHRPPGACGCRAPAAFCGLAPPTAPLWCVHDPGPHTV